MFFQAAHHLFPKTRTTKSQDRKTLLCLDMINISSIKHAPMFSHYERTLDTRGLAVDVFFNAAPTTGSQIISPFFWLLFVGMKQRLANVSGLWFVVSTA